MSYILEALRKVEQQREHLPAHGLSSRRRYYSAIDTRSWGFRPWLWLLAVIAGASASGAVVAYFSAEGDQTSALHSPDLPPATQQPTLPMAQPAAVSHAAQLPVPSVVSSTGVNQSPASAAPPRMPGPRYQPPGKTGAQPSKAVVAPSGITTVSESVQPPETKPATPPEQESPPETKQPASPLTEQETEVATVHKPPAVARERARPPAATSRGPVQDDVLDRIAAPKAVEVQPFRPNDVIRPPAARKTAPAASAEPPMLSTLPSQYQSMVPKMAINAQVYSEQAKQRFVVINMKRYNEGQSTAEGVNIVAIRKDDIVFAYQGQHFRLGR